jgi:hypothetical protein
MATRETAVLAVVVPEQRNSWGNYQVESTAIAAVSADTRPRGWRNLAQVHTHPGRMVEHSPYDDLMANSRKALSLVLPTYGRAPVAWLSDVGVHEFQHNYWYRLSLRDASARILIRADYGQIETLVIRGT